VAKVILESLQSLHEGRRHDEKHHYDQMLCYYSSSCTSIGCDFFKPYDVSSAN
jgi:hypothetical protein